MTHQFDTEIAKQVGVNAAVIYSNIEFWCAKNKANDKNFFDGNYWTYNSVRAWKELFPYLSIDQIRGAIKKLEDNGLIVSGNYNKVGYDRTKWYAINSQIHLVEIPKGTDENPKPIPDNKPDINNKPAKQDLAGFLTLWKDYSLTFLKEKGRRGGSKVKAQKKYLSLTEKGISSSEIYKFVENHAQQKIGHKDLERLLTIENYRQYKDDN